MMDFVITGNTVKLPFLDNFEIKGNPEFIYLGHKDIIIKNIAKATMIIFLTFDDEKNIIKYFLIQLEEFLSNNTSTYNYRPTETEIHGEYEFVMNNFCFDIIENAENEPKSDSAQLIDFCLDSGYKMPQVIMNHRLIYLPDKERRREILVIYAEDISLYNMIYEELYNEETGFTPLFEKAK